ncbi:hypothetical protein EHRUM4_01230 [Ehrlichia ruminantium]|uniref:Uncharacterized protein n=1 Tax=Ehrlichia ruminantium TaxID=779 RepID=A0A161LZK7_EHRRU|nr:hypothetical protein EHRUM2_01300 [Ehrlichia ruminantium]GAT79125.1 hypothetical protein EHRUM4_01230 [Ehrlichia ruminantium]
MLFDKDRIEAAIIAALYPPEDPIDIVATGIPFGICTIDSKLSIPLRLLLFIGTPITGRYVKDATNPGR